MKATTVDACNLQSFDQKRKAYNLRLKNVLYAFRAAENLMSLNSLREQ
jgi:hypothetical protein